MFGRSRVLVGVAGVVAAVAVLAGCGGGLPSALKDPGSGGVEALRVTLREALADHDGRRQCELFAPVLLEGRGGSVAACARSLGERGLPYMGSPKAYVAGGRIEFRGSEAFYLIPFGTVPSEDPGEFESESPQVAFSAVYVEGSWRVVEREGSAGYGEGEEG
jgi:hypothetical protein